VPHILEAMNDPFSMQGEAVNWALYQGTRWEGNSSPVTGREPAISLTAVWRKYKHRSEATGARCSTSG